MDRAARIALHSVRVADNFTHIHKVCGHMSPSFIKWHREHSKNAHFTDADMTKVRPICKACVYGESRQTGTDQYRIHRPLPTRVGQCFYVDAFTCGHRSAYGYKYCDLMRDGASQMIYCRSSEEVIRAFTTLWNSYMMQLIRIHLIHVLFGWILKLRTLPRSLRTLWICCATRVQNRVYGPLEQTRWGYCRMYGRIGNFKD